MKKIKFALAALALGLVLTVLPTETSAGYREFDPGPLKAKAFYLQVTAD